jgi:uncharacterized protein (DUF302 family)
LTEPGKADLIDPAMSLTTVRSAHTVPVTVDRLIAALSKRGITVFARIDHAGAARQAELELADEVLVIFGDPRLGTLLMQVDAAVGYELPLRVLVWDAGGQTMIGYRPPTRLVNDFGLASALETLRRMETLLAQITAEAARPDAARA